MWPPCTQPPIWLCRPRLHCQGDRHFIPPTWDDAGHTQPCGSWSLSSDGLPSHGFRVPCPLFFCLMKLCEEGSWAGAGSRCPQRCWGVGDVAIAVGRSPPAGKDVASVQSTGPWDPSGTADRDGSPPAAGPPVGLSGDTHDNEAGSTVCLMARRGRVMCRWAVSLAGLGGAQQDPCGLRCLGACCAGRAGLWFHVGSSRVAEGPKPRRDVQLWVGGVEGRAGAGLGFGCCRTQPAGREYGCVSSAWALAGSP